MKLRKSIAFLLSMILILVSAGPVQALDAPVIVPTDERSKTLKKIEITGVDAAKAGEYLDTTAVVKADENITWEIPVFWLGTHDAVSGDSRGDYTVSVSETDGKTRKIRVSYIETQGADAVKAEKDGYYIPVLSFFLPLVYNCGGKVELDKYLSDLFDATGGVMTIENPADGITYITGMIGGLKKFPVGQESEETVPETASDRVAPSGNEEPGTAADAALNIAGKDEGEDLTEDIGTKNEDESGEKTDDESGTGPIDDPKDENPTEEPTENPTEEPAEPEKTKYELFADSYYRDTKNPDFGILFPNGASDLDDMDWYAYIDAFGFKEMSYLTSPSSNLNTMMNNYLGIEELKSSDWYRNTIRTPRQNAYSAVRADKLASLPEELKKACDDRAGLYISQDDLEEFLDLIVNVIQPHAVNLIKDRIPAFQAAGDRELGKEVGLRICYSSPGTLGTTYNMESGADYRYKVEFYANSFENGRDEEHNITLNLDDKMYREGLACGVLHEDVHVFMNDFTRLGMQIDPGVEGDIVYDDDGNYSIQYNIPGYEPMTLDEYSDYHNDYMLYPDWFAEGTAQLICGFYHDSFTEDLFNKIRIKENDGVTYTKERIKAQYTEKIRTLDPETYSQDTVFGSYCYGPLAVMYLLDRHLQASGKPSALKYDDDGTLTYVNVTELRDSMSDVLLLLHSEKTLDEIIQDTLGEDCDTFEDMFIGGEEAGNTSLDFCTDVLNYLEKASQKIGERATGSILQDFDRPYSDLWIFDENETSDYYNFVITDNNYATSTADPEIAEKSKPAKIFDQEAYRAEMAEKENAALVGTGDRNVSAGEAGTSGNAALPEQDTLLKQEAASEPADATGQETAAEVKAVPEKEAAAENNGVQEEEATSTDTEVSGQDDSVEEAGGYDYEEPAGSDCSEELTYASESCAEEAASEYEPSGNAA